MPNENMNSGKGTLSEIWERLEPLCARLWAENSPVAVGVQTIHEEFAGKVQRVDQMLAAAKERVAGLEESLARKNDECDELLEHLRAKEEENAEFHDRYLKSGAAQDEERAKKMEAFYQEMTKKKDSLEQAWEARRVAQEEQYGKRLAELQKKNDELTETLKARAADLESRISKKEDELSKAHDRMMQEMTAWDAKNRLKEETLLKRDKELADHERLLKDDYNKKILELQSLKEALQQEVSAVVRQYQAKVKREGPDQA